MTTAPDKLAIGLEAPTHVRKRVLGFLCVMSFILYLDRICISQAVESIKKDLDITDTNMGFVLGAFTLAYGLFDLPVGHCGDRYGARKVLTCIVWIWSVLTIITGAANGLLMLLVVRFLFGAGQAGAFPNAIKALERWFPAHARGPAVGIMLMSALVGGSTAPVVAEKLINFFGWRWSFVVLGAPGLLWGAWFYWWYRDDPGTHPAANEAERSYIALGRSAKTPADDHLSFPWIKVLTSSNLWLMAFISTCASFTTYFFFSWYSPYLQQGRSLDSGVASWMTSMVLISGAAGSFCGGYVTDWLVRLTGERTWSRRLLAAPALTCAAGGMALSVQCDDPWLAAMSATCACFAIHLGLPAGWCVVTEISGPHLGALFGLLNSVGVLGGFAAQVFQGRFVDYMRGLGYLGRERWDPAFYVYAGLLLAGAVGWFFVNPQKRVVD